MAITFTVPGDPVPQPRPRVSTRGGFARAYVPSTHPVHDYRGAIASAAADAGLTPTGEPLNVVIDAVFVRPKSHMRKSGVRADAPRLPRPDVDNSRDRRLPNRYTKRCRWRFVALRDQRHY